MVHHAEIRLPYCLASALYYHPHLVAQAVRSVSNISVCGLAVGIIHL